jgi:hypothetical protein
LKLLKSNMSCNAKSRVVINTIEKVTNVVLQLYISNIVDIIEVVVEKSTIGGGAGKVCFVFSYCKIFA